MRWEKSHGKSVFKSKVTLVLTWASTHFSNKIYSTDTHAPFFYSYTTLILSYFYCIFASDANCVSGTSSNYLISFDKVALFDVRIKFV